MVSNTKSLLVGIASPQVFFDSLLQRCWGRALGAEASFAAAPPPTPPGRQEPSLPRGPKGHLTKQPGLLQHCCSEGFRLCFLLNSLSLVKEISQRLGLITASIFLPRSGVFVHFAPEPICQARHGGAIRELTQPVWARSPQCCCR